MSDTYSVITKKRRIDLCKVTSGAVSSIPPIREIALGDGGVNDEGEPLIPTEDQHALKHQIAKYPIEPVTYPLETTARYSIVVPAGDLVGEKISEAALLDEEGKLCAIRNMYPKQKDDGVKFTFTFDDEF